MKGQILQNRLKKEIMNLERDPPPGVNCYPKEDDLTDLEAYIKGPPDSPYENGLFKLQVKIPQNYPFDPPQIRFSTFIYHPNIDDKGRICADILKKGEKGGWNPALNLSTTLLLLSQLLAQPNPDDPLDAEIAKEYQFDYPTFKQKATEFTKKYANKDQLLSEEQEETDDNEPTIEPEELEKEEKVEEVRKPKLSLSRKRGANSQMSSQTTNASIPNTQHISSSSHVIYDTQVLKELTADQEKGNTPESQSPLLSKSKKKINTSKSTTQHISSPNHVIYDTQVLKELAEDHENGNTPESQSSKSKNKASASSSVSSSPKIYTQLPAYSENPISIESSPEVQIESKETDDLLIDSLCSSPLIKPISSTKEVGSPSLENSPISTSLYNSQFEDIELKSYQQRPSSIESSPKLPPEKEDRTETPIDSPSPSSTIILDEPKSRRSLKREFDQAFIQQQNIILLSDDEDNLIDDDSNNVVFTLQLSRKKHRKKLSLQRRKK